MTVDGTLVHDELAVNILSLNGNAVAVKLDRFALCTERDEHRQSAEVVDMMINGTDAERTEVGDYHRAVEWADIEQLLRQQAEVIADIEQPNDEADEEAGHLGKLVCKLLRAVFLIGGFDLLYLLVHLTVDIEDGVRGVKLDLDGGLGSVDSEASLDRQHDLNVIAGVHPAADDKAVEGGQLCNGPDIGCDEKMQHADALVAVETLLPEPAVGVCYLKRFLVIVACIVSVRHYVGNEVEKAVE